MVLTPSRIKTETVLEKATMDRTRQGEQVVWCDDTRLTVFLGRRMNGLEEKKREQKNRNPMRARRGGTFTG